jgi:hypothetical protein
MCVKMKIQLFFMDISLILHDHMFPSNIETMSSRQKQCGWDEASCHWKSGDNEKDGDEASSYWKNGDNNIKGVDEASSC